jgi:DnaJ-class molecular chaperone
MSNKFNPAYNTDPENLVKFKKINEAYQCIKSYPCRIQYKKFGAYIQSLAVTAEDNKSSGGQQGN